jgi:hypothetical protein
MDETLGWVESNAAAKGMVSWEGEAPAEPRISCARRSRISGSAGASPSRTRLVTLKFDADTLSLLSGRKRQGNGTTVDEDRRTMKANT